ncbi:LacI family DNA-binding transcriptional regulator [Tessaracoccus antarcticus]|uniref:LacI family transcriptional regulator n=1 Tax=Tessaracoccus antarcticus TaxID=2479848 RepID=A0A3M0GAS7_9ACTN|nr:LacI family DNA-binding transcriptional regulator [Tessaracoccus antarcticus]RMB62024.1 LacI family transcriptional regulator [Tessaracoccus antarcticus]
MATTLKDVAEHAGVSVKTVSNVVNARPNISATMRSRVQASLDALGYRPNLAARQLKHGRGGFIALAVPQLDSPYFSELASHLAAQATRRGYILLMDITGADKEQERLALSGMSGQMVDGVILSPLGLTAAEIDARHSSVPLVLLGERAVPSGVDHISVDSVAASRAVGEFLLASGRRRLAAIGREPIQGTSSVRLEGFQSAVEDAGLRLPGKRIVRVRQFDREHGYSAMQQLLDLPEQERPDAVFAFNDLLAIGAMRACLERGVRIPEDIAVVGFDDIPEGRFHTPSLTTVAPDLAALASIAIDRLILTIEGGSQGPERIFVPWELRFRESTAT